MFKPLVLYIGLRYTRAKRRTQFISFITLTSVLGIALGVTALITVLSVMNGFEATERIRQLPDYKNVPIIALTAFAMKGDREKCLESGATDYIPKPIDSKEFLEKVKYYTNKLS